MFTWCNDYDVDRAAHDALVSQFAAVSAMETLLAALFPPLPGLSAWIPVISAQLPILDPRGLIVGFEDLGVDAFRQPLDDAAPATTDGEYRVQLALYVRPTVSSVAWLLREINTYRTYQSVYRDAPARDIVVVGTGCPERALFINSGIVVIDRSADGWWRLWRGGIDGPDVMVELEIGAD